MRKITKENFIAFLSFEDILEEVTKKTEKAFKEAYEERGANPDDINFDKLVSKFENDINPVFWFGGLFPWSPEDKERYKAIHSRWENTVKTLLSEDA